MKKILIVEDDKFLANAYNSKLSRAGFEIRIAVDGEEVFQILKEFTPDMILLDLILPKKDGFTVLEELKASEQWKNIPVLISSNLGQQEDIERGMKLGAIDYIVKTDIILNDLVMKINYLLKSS